MLQQCSLRFRTDPMCQTLITNEYLLKIFVILLMLDGHWLHTECSRTAEMMDLVSFFQTHIGLFVLFRWELLSQRVKSLFQAIHTCEGSIPYNFAAFHGTYLCCVFAH